MTAPSGSPAWDERAASRRFLDVVVLGAAAALATGFVHTLVLAVARIAFDRLVWHPRGFFWMSPLAYGLVLAPGVLALGILTLTSASKRVVGFTAFAIGTTCVFGLLLPWTQVSRAAALVLAAGVGVQLARMVMRRADRWIAWSQRLLLASLLVLPMLGWAQHRRLNEASPSQLGITKGQPPNILLIVMDDVRAKNVTLNTPGIHTTPGLVRRAAEGVTFDFAFSAAPWSLPSHASMFTGLYPRQQNGDWLKPLQGDVLTLAESLRDRGYTTAGFVANLHYAGWDSGLAQGFDRYEDFTTDWLQVIRCSSFGQTALFTQLIDAKSPGDAVSAFLHPDLSLVRQHTYRVKLADRIRTDFLRWQSSIGERPFFAFLNVMDAHLPYLEPEPIRSRFPASDRDVRSYEGAIGFIDAQIDSILNALEQQGVLDRTIVVVTADHGDLIGEHGLAGHNSLYLDVLHVPLLIRYPGVVPRGVRVPHPVTLRDLAATIIDLSNAESVLPGSSLQHAWEGRPDLLSPVLAEVRRQPNPLSDNPASQGDMRALFDDSLHYIVNEGTGREELYAWRVDAAEARNLADGDSGAARLQPWRDRLARVLREVQVRRPNDRP